MGYLIDTEEPMYHLHIGVDSPYNLGGWDVAFFLEVGYFDTDASFLVQARDTATAALFGTATLDYEAIPFTANVKLERSIGNRLNAYVGAGVGFALVDATLTMPFGLAGFDDSDTVFACQVFAGLQYDVSEAFELYTGVRWMYFGSTDNVGSFDDVLVELGGRINF